MKPQKTIRTLVVDDEPPARQKIVNLLKKETGIELIGECANGQEAVAMIRAKKPDLLFLDIQMPEVDGFGVLHALQKETLPAVVFVTAYDQYAIRAFEVHAVDYLLKPFDRDRFHTAVEQARQHLAKGQAQALSEKLLSLLDEMKTKGKIIDRLAVKSEGKIFFIKIDDIDWIEASGNYVRLHMGSLSHLVRETMNGIQKKLDQSKFLRIHRSTFVNIERIKELQPWFHGDYVVILKDGTQLTMSRGYRSNLPELLGKTE